jgi:uncharacterized protein YbbK (DUF523 family)
MRLPQHLSRIGQIRRPTEDDPWRILMSGCLFGHPCGVDGDNYGLPAHQPRWLPSPKVQLIPFCPEDVGMGTPRTMPDLHGGDGFDVLDGRARILDEHRRDLTEAMLRGAHAMLARAQAMDVDFALLTDRSAACGSQVVSTGCRFEEPVQHRRGVGVATALLLRHGFAVVSQRDYRSLEYLGQRLDPNFEVNPAALDHHESPWVVANLPLD